jgi:hypothetical protein
MSKKDFLIKQKASGDEKEKKMSVVLTKNVLTGCPPTTLSSSAATS